MRRLLLLIGLPLIVLLPSAASAATASIHTVGIVHQRDDHRVEMFLHVDHDRDALVHGQVRVHVLDHRGHAVAQGRASGIARTAGAKHSLPLHIVLSRGDSAAVTRLLRHGNKLRARVSYLATIGNATATQTVTAATTVAFTGTQAHVTMQGGPAVQQPINVVVWPNGGNDTNCQATVLDTTALQVACADGVVNLEGDFSSPNVTLDVVGSFGDQDFSDGYLTGTVDVVNGQVTQLQLSGFAGDYTRPG